MTDKWAEFQDVCYRLEDLGRPAVFLIPSHKLCVKIGEETAEDQLHRFLFQHFGAFTTTTLPYFGFWRNWENEMIYDACRQYEVSFVGKDRVVLLLRELARICRAIGEDCLYFKAGQYTCLVYPREP